MPAEQKRSSLIQAAKKLFHARGFEATSLSHIADESEVPLGNIYYYFKSKDELASAVAREHLQSFKLLFSKIEAQYSDPGQRLLAFLDFPFAQRRSFTSHGCPVGTLSLELNKADTGTREVVREIFRLQLNWFKKQFAILGQPNPADQAYQLVSALQGAILLANTFNDTRILTRQIKMLRSRLQQSLL